MSNKLIGEGWGVVEGKGGKKNIIFIII